MSVVVFYYLLNVTPLIKKGYTITKQAYHTNKALNFDFEIFINWYTFTRFVVQKFNFSLLLQEIAINR